MKSNHTLTLETLDNKAGFTLTSSANNYVNILFEDAPAEYMIGQTIEALVLMISQEIRATAFMPDDNVVLYLNKETEIPQSFSLKFENITALEIVKDKIILHLNNTVIYADIKDCQIVGYDINTLTILMNNADAQIEFYTNIKSVVSAKSVSIQSIDNGRMVIPASKRIPEFVISIYDDDARVRPRPVRFGVPVISTVPGFIPDASWNISTPQEDKDLMELGVGTDTRKMYFRVISDQLLETSLRDKLKLEIDLPAGVDTLVETISLPLVYDSTEDVNDIFDGDYIFHKEDTINFVDGFAYLSVKMPLKIQRNLPLSFQVSSDGNVFLMEPVESDVAMVDELSVHTNVVQSTLTKSVQDSKASTAKKKKTNKSKS